MPVLFIEAPGILPGKKRVMTEKTAEAMDEAYHIGGTPMFLREYAVEDVAMDGHIPSANLKISKRSRKSVLESSSCLARHWENRASERRNGFSARPSS